MAILSKLPLAALGVLALANTANAGPDTYDEQEVPPDVPNDTTVWRDPQMMTGIGVGIIVGGGVAGFTDQSMRNVLSSNVAGLWDARLAIGTHVPIGLDLSYVGEASDMRTLTGQSNGTLLGTTAEAALRWNIAPRAAFTPYLFAGIGWQRFDLQNMTFATSDTGIKSTDNLVEYPMGVGFTYRDPSGLLVDIRGTYRLEPDSTLVVDPTNRGAFASASWWEAGGAIGYEF